MKSKRPRSATDLVAHHRAVAVVLLENVRVDGHRFLECREGLRIFLLCEIGVAEIGIETGHLGLDGDGLLVEANGPAVLLLRIPGRAEVAVAGGEVLIDFGRALVVLRCALQIVLLLLGDADGVRVGRVVRIFRGELAVNQLGLMVFLPRHVDARLQFFFFLGRKRWLLLLIGRRRLKRCCA